MKEYPLDLTKSVMSGLSGNSEARNAQGLAKCLGLRPRLGNLVHGETIHNPLGQLSVSWPYPQIFFGMEETIVATATTIYSVKEEFSWDLTELVTDITQGTGWQFADFGDFWVMFNGVEIVLRDGDGAVIYTTPVANAGACYNGRMFWGGFKPEFWSPAWRTELDKWLAVEATGLTSNYLMKPNVAFWGMPGGGDFKLWLSDPTPTSYAVVGPAGAGYGYDANRPFWQDLLRQRTIGWQPMPWKGTIKAFRGLGKYIIVYGSGGISALDPVDASYGVKELTNEIGIIGRLAVTGNQEIGDVFIGTDKNAYSLSPNLELKRLGYGEHLQDMDQGTVASFDGHWKEFYFSNPKRCFVLTPGGMGESHQPTTCLARRHGKLLGVTMPGTETRNRIDMETETFRMGSGSYKMLRMVTMGLNRIQNSKVHAKFRVDTDEEKFRVGPEVRVNPAGSAYIGISATDFRVNLVGEVINDSAAVTDFRVRWQVADNRDARGLFGSSESK